jgi:two-component SAPR family response regulator
MSLKCLIVDDEPNAVNLLEMFIQQNTAWELLAKCYDAREALTFLKTHAVDLIFLDINMPHLTGMEMAACYRLRPGSSSPPPTPNLRRTAMAFLPSTIC